MSRLRSGPLEGHLPAGQVRASPTYGQATALLASQSPSAGTTYTPQAAPKLPAVWVVTVTSVARNSNTITGSRTTVSGKPGIKIDGVTSGIEDCKTVVPYFLLPSETSFPQGSARPVNTDGSFTWQSKTGKQFYAYVSNEDDALKSNRVTIPAN